MLTREEAHTSISRHRDGKFDANDVGKLIHQIYNEFEAQIKAKDERIRELEEAMKPKTCKGCVHEVGDMQDLYCAFCSRSCDDNFEPKDNK